MRKQTFEMELCREHHSKNTGHHKIEVTSHIATSFCTNLAITSQNNYHDSANNNLRSSGPYGLVKVVTGRWRNNLAWRRAVYWEGRDDNSRLEALVPQETGC